jgi:hypothetical protein
MNGHQGLNSFQLDYELAGNQQVNSPLANCVAFEGHAHGSLTNERHFPQTKLYAQGFFVYGLQEPRAKMPMDLDGRTDDLIRQTINLLARFNVDPLASHRVQNSQLLGGFAVGILGRSFSSLIGTLPFPWRSCPLLAALAVRGFP